MSAERRLDVEKSLPAEFVFMTILKVVRIGGILLFFILIAAALGLAFFRQIEGANLRSLISERQTLQQQLSNLDKKSRLLQETRAGELAGLDKQINLLKEDHAIELAQKDNQIKRLRVDHAAELAQRDRQINELKQTIRNAK